MKRQDSSRLEMFNCTFVLLYVEVLQGIRSERDQPKLRSSIYFDFSKCERYGVYYTLFTLPIVFSKLF